MFVPDEIPMHKIVLAVFSEIIKDAYYTAWTTFVVKTSKIYDYLEDGINERRILNLRLTSNTQPTFSRFQDLPTELRQLIWRHAVLAYPSRTIEIRADKHTKVNSSPTSLCQIPSLLHTCQSSRSEALRHYSLAFGVGDLQPKIYVNFHEDVVYFEARDEGFGLLNPNTAEMQDLDRIQKLAILIPRYLYDARWRLDAFRNLKELVLVVQHGERTFDLGPDPTLVLGRDAEDMISGDTGSASSQERDMVAGRLMYAPVIKGFFEKMKSDNPGWGVPVLKQGYFVKGERDKWYFTRTGDLWPF